MDLIRDRADPDVRVTAMARMAAKIIDVSTTLPHSEPPRRNTSPIRAIASRKMPLAIRVKLWKTTSRETWMSTDQRRLRTAATAISGAARMMAGARPSTRAKDRRWNSTPSA